MAAAAGKSQQQQQQHNSITSSASSQSEEEEEEENNEDRCGTCGLSPSWLQPCRSFLLLFVCLVVANLTCSLLASYHNAMVSTFEKRFNWKTRTVGFILSANDYGYLATVLFTAHFGGMSHRPRLLAACSGLYGVSGIVYFLPYLLYGAKFTTETVFQQGLNLSESSSVAFCRANNQLKVDELISTTVPTENDALTSDIQSNVAFGIFMFAGAIQGVAVGPFWNVAFAMIDDMTKQWSGVFIGLYTLLRAIGPVLGYQLGAGTTKLNENLSGTLQQFAGSQKSPLWIGAWWLGYLATGIIVICFSLPLFLFPRNVPLKVSSDPAKVKNPIVRMILKKSDLAKDTLRQEEQEENDPDSQRQEATFIGLLQSMKRLLQNKIFLCLLIGNLFEFTALNTPVNYIAKYLEHHFDLMQSEASMVTGIITPMGFGLGLALSILVSFRFQMGMYSLARFHAFVHLFGIVRYIGGMLFTCDTPLVQTPANGVANGSLCGSCSSCSAVDYFPVCDGNITYFSPCTAGCTNSLTSGCVCAAGSSVRRGTCEGACYTSVIGYSVFTVLLAMLQSSARTQEAVINLRCVQPRDKALALAASSFLWGLVSSLLPPIVGSVFDSICLIRSSSGARSYCEMYDRVKFRYAFHLLSVVAHTIACVFFFLIWYYCAKRYGRGSADETVELKMGRQQQQQLQGVDAEAAQPLNREADNPQDGD